MRSNYRKVSPNAALLAATVLLSVPGVSSAQVTVNLTASQQSTTLPDGNTVPMWGWTCTNATASGSLGAGLSSITVTTQPTAAYITPTATIGLPQVAGGAVATATVSGTTVLTVTITNPGSGYTAAPAVTITDSAASPTGAGAVATAALSGSAANCTALTYTTNTVPVTVAATPQPQVGGTVWQPPLIEIPYNPAGNSLTINLTNKLPVNTSLTIIGQATATTQAGNGGLGSPMRETGPRTDGDHQTQTSTTWTTVAGGSFIPPIQEARARSFAPEAGGVATVGATPAVATYTWTNLQPGTYLMRTGTYPSIQGPMGLYGVVVVTQAPVASVPGVAYPAPPAVGLNVASALKYDADVVALESEIDARQNNMVAALFVSGTACTGVGVPVAACTGAGVVPAAAVATANAGFLEIAKWNPECGAGPNGLTSKGTAPTCYPPAVDYTPLYFLVNGVAFSKDNRLASALPIPATVTATTGNVLIRYVNAGSHMHIPSINGLSQLLVTEDAYVLPDVALALGQGKALTAVPSAVSGVPSGLHLRNEVWQAAGKVADVIVSPTVCTAAGAPVAACTAAITYAPGQFLIFDRSLRLSTNNEHDGGMQALLDVADTTGGAAVAATNQSAVARNDAYAYSPGVPLTVSDPGKGVIANDSNVYGVQVLAAPLHGTVALNPNGTFTYVQGANGISLTFISGGSGYTTTTPIVTISPPPAGGTTATATATVGSSGVSVALVNGGSGYTAPLVTIGAPPAGGTQATATAVLSNGVITAIPLTSGGMGYVAPNVVITDTAPGTGSGATATATVSGGVITGIVVTNGGANYSAPVVTFSEAPATPAVVGAITISNGVITALNVTPGTGYTVPPLVTITDSTGTLATATASVSGNAGVVTAVNLTYAGSGYTAAPTVTIAGGATPANVMAAVNAGFAAADQFTYCANGSVTGTTCSSGVTAAVSLTVSATVGTVPTANPDSYGPANGYKSASLIKIGAPGVLLNDVDPNGYAMTAVFGGACAAPIAGAIALAAPAAGNPLVPGSGNQIPGTVILNTDGGFTAVPTNNAGGTYYFCYQAKNSQGSLSNAASVALVFPTPSNLSVSVRDATCASTTPLPAVGAVGGDPCAITDYKWIIEQDLTVQINPACQQNGAGGAKPANCPLGVPQTPATQFHTSFMPVIAEGCTGAQSCERGQTVYDAGPPCTSPGVPAGCSATAGQHVAAACDGRGICTIGQSQLVPTLPSTANLSATNPDGTPANYYISILAGDSQNAFAYGNAKDPSNPANCTPATGQTEPTGFTTSSTCGHTMGGAPVPAPTCVAGVAGAPAVCSFAPVVVNLQQAPLKTATVTAFIFEDDFPLNGEPDTGGGIDSLATIEVPLGDFQIEIWDDAGGVGDFTGQMTYDMFNMPLTNALNGTIDPQTGLDACPIANTAAAPTGNNAPKVAAGTIIVCPQYESDGKTPSPLTGQMVVKNLMQGKFSLIAHPGEAREAAGEEWLQTNSLDGGHFLDSFLKVGEPPYFQEFGPGGYHVFFGFANPKIINARLAVICNPATPANPQIPFAPPCRNTLNGQVTNLHQSRAPNEQLFGGNVFPGPNGPLGANSQFPGMPGNYAMLGYTNCYAAIGDTDGATIAFAKCDKDGNFTFSGLPDGNYGVVIFDQWNDIIVDGSSHAVSFPANANPLAAGTTLNVTYPSFTWQAHLWSRTYIDTQGTGAPTLLADGTLDPAKSPGVLQVPTRIRQPNGKFVNMLLTDIGGNTPFDETFPLFAWYSVESDNTRFRGTGVHVVNDAGGQVDGPAPVGNGVTSSPVSYQGVLNSNEAFSVPPALRVPGAVYCAAGDPQCANTNFVSNPSGNGGTAGTCGAAAAPALANTLNCTGLSTGRIDPGSVTVEGWQGGVSEYDMVDWGKTPYDPAETGGIRGHVVNATTRPFDDPRMLFQNLWEPLVPNVTINLYKEGTAPDGTTSLTLVDTTQTQSWDTWAQGFRADGVTPNMSCPGQDPNDPFFSYTMAGTTNYLYPGTPLPNIAQFKCFDGYHNLNQIQPATYDGLFQFPSATCLGLTNNGSLTFTIAGNLTPYNCGTIPNPAYGSGPGTLGYQTGALPRMLPPGKYVTEIILPAGWQLNKEEDLNLLIGDQYIAPVVQQFVGLANIFILPDQASIDSWNPSYTGPYTSNPAANGTSGAYNQPWSCTGTPGTAGYSCALTPNSTNNGKPSTDYGRSTFGNFGPGGLIVQSAPCVGQMRIVPDYLSISPESGEISPFAGSLRALCDRKEITIAYQMQADVDFYIYTMTPKTTNFTGFISDDFSSEFDPASPAFGEKFAIPNVPVSIRDFNGNEISRMYSDQWGTFNGLVYSTWEVDPPNITGYSPNMMITCMNDPGPIPDPAHPGQTMMDPYYNPAYSAFCYENPFMPGDTTYLDTPVIPLSAFAEGYNPPDCAYPDGTPMIKSVTGDPLAGGSGPWVAAAGSPITITALAPASGAGVPVPNNAYSGPAATAAPYNQKFVNRHYGFGSATGTVTIGGVVATGCSWSDASITCPVPTLPNCTLQQQVQYGGPNGTTVTPAQCGELVITTPPSAAYPHGQQSIDAVTVTVGGKPPAYVNGENPASNAIQTAIDNAMPGDLIIVGPGTYTEMVLMWKPLRLQGVGDGAVTVNAAAHPAEKLLPAWRRKVNCLFGLALNGGYINNNVNATNANGTSAYNPYDPTGTYSASCPFYNSVPGLVTGQNVVDPIPAEATIGWDATLNGNLAELLQEPTLMGAYEGAAITVLAKGLENNNTSETTSATDCNPANPLDCILLNNQVGAVPPNGFNNGVGDCDPTSVFVYSNFQCNPSRIDGITFTNSSQGGGGVFLHGFAHNIEISNLSVHANGGTLTGGITIGQIEHLDLGDTTVTVGNATVIPAVGYDQNVSVHNNNVSLNAAYGDEINSNTPASAGGVTFCSGSDNYKFQFNWVCGNWSAGDGGGLSHHGFSYNGDIEHNSFLFNQSINPSLVTYGGGAVILGQAPDGTLGEAGTAGDIDVAPALSDGIGPGLVINANLFQGNTAEEGSGGGLALLHVNGTDVQNNASDSTQWYGVSITNNIFANNVAGWAGGGVVMQDAVKVDFRNNTVISNDSTSSAGVEFNSNGAPLGNVPPPPPPGSGATATAALNGTGGVGPIIVTAPGSGYTSAPTVTISGGGGTGATATAALNGTGGVGTITVTAAGTGYTAVPTVTVAAPGVPCNPTTNTNCTGFSFTASVHLPGGLVTEHHSANLTAAFTNPNVPCPAGHPQCTTFSNPVLANNMFWRNRSFLITTATSPIAAVQLNPVLTQPPTPQSRGGVVTGGTGACPTTGTVVASATDTTGLYWDIGVYGDQFPADHSSGLTLHPTFSVIDAPGNYPESGNRNGNGMTVTSQYCNGSRVPPEIAPQLCSGPNGFANAPGCIQPGTVGVSMTVPGGVPDSLVPPLPAFTITPAATIDEGNNWINMFYGPLSLSNPTTGQNVPLGNFAPATGSPAIGAVPVAVAHPATDFFGNPRPDSNNSSTFDIGAIEVGTSAVAGVGLILEPASLPFGTLMAGTTAMLTATLTNNGAASAALTYSGLAGTPFSRIGTPGGCGGVLVAGGVCTIDILYAPPKSQATNPINYAATLTILSAGTPAASLGLTGSAWSPLSPSALAFGNQQVGTVSAARSVTLSNQMGTTPLTVTAFTKTGGQFAAPTFSAGCGVSGLPAGLPLVLAPGVAGTCTVSEQFAPTSATPPNKTGSLNFTITGTGIVGGGPYSVPMTGTAVAPSFSLTTATPAPLNFGVVQNHARSASQPVTLTNTGSGPLTITNIGFSGGGGGGGGQFTQNNNCGPNGTNGTPPFVLAVAGFCTINVSLAPTTGGAKAANLSVTGASGAGTHTVALTGTSTVTTAGEAAAGFTTTPADTSVKNGTITVTNTGGGPFTLTAAPVITLAGSGNPGTPAAGFVITGGSCTTGFPVTVPAGGQCVISATYTPASAASVSVRANLTGTGFTGTTANATPNFTAN